MVLAPHRRTGAERHPRIHARAVSAFGEPSRVSRTAEYLEGPEVRASRHDADDRAVDVVETDGSADRARIRREELRPQVVADDHDRLAAASMLLREECAAGLR